MLPPKKEYERVKTDDFVTGIIEKVEYEQEHEFKGKPTAENPTGLKTGPAVRLAFDIDGMKFPKKSGWMTFSYAEKSNLYGKYLINLVENAKPNMVFHIEQLEGLKVKMLWKDNPKDPQYQNLDTIRPLDGKKLIPVEGEVATVGEEQPPF